MSDQTQAGVVTKISRGQSQQQTGGHLVFVDPTADNASERVQEVLLLQPLLNFQVHDLTGHDVVGQITKRLQSAIPETIRSITIICGREICANQPFQSSHKRAGRKKLDARVADWQSAFAPRTVCYLLGDLAADLAEQIRHQTTAEIRFDFDSMPHVMFDEVMFIDHSVTNFEPIVKEILLARDVEVVTFDSESNGVEQIARHLANRKDIQAIHLICPATEREIRLGNAVVNQETLGREYRTAMQRIRQSLATDSEIRIYNGRFNRHSQGVETLKAISGELGAFVVVVKCHLDSVESDTSLLGKLKPASIQPNETAAWAQLLSPMKMSEPESVISKQRSVVDGQLEFNAAANEILIRYKFDRLQAAGWLCIGFVVGFLCQKVFFQWGI